MPAKTKKPLVALTTQVSEPEIFTVDDETYEILGLEHRSKEDEAEIFALFTQSTALQEKLEQGSFADKEEAKQTALELRELREQILVSMTTLPLEIAEKLPISQVVVLFEHLAELTGGKEE